MAKKTVKQNQQGNLKKTKVSETRIYKGLAGVTVDTTSVSKVMPETNSLTYRGYAVQDLAANCRFEEVAYLLLYGDLPTRSELRKFEKSERSRRNISRAHTEVIRRYPRRAHPMDTLRTSVSYLGTSETAWGGEDADKDLDRAMDMLAKIPTMIATDYRFRKGMVRRIPRKDLTISENFFHMCFGKIPPKEVIRAFDISLILYAEHSFNASTFTARVITSSRSDIYSAVAGGIGSLKGPLHGGANEAVMKNLLEIKNPSKAEEWLREKQSRKELVMGFGHRVYKQGDSRVPTMRAALEGLSSWKKESTWLEISDILQTIMIEEKGIHPNLDFPAGPAYYLMGFDIDMYTPIFVMSRITGWAAHVIEQNANNSLIRPLSAYEGKKQRRVKAISKR